MYLILSADYYGSYARDQVIDQEQTKIVFINEKTMTGKLIGKTKDVVFLLKGEKVSALAISSSVKEIQLK